MMVMQNVLKMQKIGGTVRNDRRMTSANLNLGMFKKASAMGISDLKDGLSNIQPIVEDRTTESEFDSQSPINSDEDILS